jgi:hypothetical protein
LAISIRPLIRSSQTTLPVSGFLNRITGATPSGGRLADGVLGAPATVVARLLAAGHLRRAQFVELGRLHVTAVREAALLHLAQDRPVPIHPLHLIERTLLVGQAEPGQRIEDRLHGLRRRPRDVRVLDAQDESSAMASRIRPREERRARASKMQEACWTRGEAGAYLRHH